MRAAVLAAMLTVGGAVALAADAAPSRVERLVEHLGSGGFREREAATRELDSLGEVALEPLRRAAASGEPEVRRRAADLVERINDRLATVRILAATLVEFDFNDKPLIDAITDLNRRTGASINLHDQTPNKFRGRKVTASTGGPVPFWDAVELLCRKADIHEWDGVTQIPGMATQQAAATQIQGLGGFQGQIFINRRGSSRQIGGPAPNAMILLDGPSAAMPTHRGGAVRVRVLPPGTALPNATHTSDEVLLALQVSAEPKLNWQATADVRIDRAVDETGRSLSATGAFAMTPVDEDEIFINQVGVISQAPVRRAGSIGVRIRRGDKPAQRLAELIGSIAAQVRLSEPMVSVPTPLKSVGQSTRGGHGVNLSIKSATRADNGDINITTEVQMPPDVQLPQVGGGMNGAFNGVMVGGGVLQIQGNIAMKQIVIGPGNVVMNQSSQGQLRPGETEYLGLAIEDAKGKRFTVTRGQLENPRFGTEGTTLQLTVTFRPLAEKDEAARLVFTATRLATIDIPFAVKDVPLP
jgi:hypothetical protein